MSDERRNFTRVLFHVFAEINYQGVVVTGQVTDLSLKGLFLNTDRIMAIGENVEMKLWLAATNPPLEFHLRADVARVAPGGIGLKISEADVQSFTHLRNIVAMQVDDPDHVLDELLPKH